MTSEEKQDRIDQYLLGRADENARREIAEESTRDEGLLRDLEDTKAAMAAIELAEDRALKVRLRGLEADLGQSDTPDRTAKVVGIQNKGRNVMRYLAYAAALLLLLAVGWWAINPGQQSPQQLAMASFEAYPNIAFQLERSGPEATSPEALAFLAYEAGDYALAATRFGALAASPTNRFYLAQSELAREDFSAAIPIFRELSENQAFALAAESEYFYAVALLGSGAKDEAANALQAISEAVDHPMAEEAAELLAKIN